jgi:heparan-sulfate lyase
MRPVEWLRSCSFRTFVNRQAIRTVSLVLLLGVFASSLAARDAAFQSPYNGPSTTDEEILAELNPDFAGMDQVHAAMQRHDLVAVKRAYLEYRRTKSTAQWTVMPSAMPAVATQTDDPIGDELLGHHVRNFYYGFSPHEANMGRDFDWTYNPVNRDSPNFSYEWTWCAISRTQFWRKLVDAYWKTHDEKYAREWIAELQDFAIKNPRIGDGAHGRVPLWRTLDAAIRMLDSWPYAYYHVLNSPSFTPEAQWTYLKLIRDHGVLLEDGLKDPSRTGNWVATECFGLYTVATLYPELRDSARWRQVAIDRILKEMNRAVPPDGFEAELTPNYHMVTLEGFLGPTKLATLNHDSLPEGLQAKIMSMYRALVVVMAQDGSVVSTNDSVDINAIDLARKGLQLAYDPLLDWATSEGMRGKGLHDSTMLPYAGFYTMRGGWKPDDLFLFFRAGPTGIGHQHEDMLQVVLRDWGKTLLLEPGTSLYDHSDWRRFIIGTESHNTIVVDGKWQHREASKAPVLNPVDNPWITTPLFDFVSGTYSSGYQKNDYNSQKQFGPSTWVGSVDNSVVHTRKVLYLRPYYALLLDTLNGSGTHTIDSHFDVDSPSVRIDPKTQAAFSQNPGDVQVGLYPLERENLSVKIIQGAHGAPDIQWKIPTVQFRKQQTVPAIFGTFLYPYKGAAPAFTAVPLVVQGSGVWGQTINTDKEEAEIAIVKNGAPASFTMQSSLLGKLEITGAGLLIRRPSGRQDVLVGSWGMHSFAGKGLRFTTDAPASLLIAVHNGHTILSNGGNDDIKITLQQPIEQTISLLSGQAVDVDSKDLHPSDVSPSLFQMPANDSSRPGSGPVEKKGNGAKEQ